MVGNTSSPSIPAAPKSNDETNPYQKAAVDNLLTKFASAQRQQMELKTVLEQQRILLKKVDQVVKSTEEDEGWVRGEAMPNTGVIERLLQIPSLDSVKDEDVLHGIFEQATDSLQEASFNYDHLNWTAMEEVLEKKYPPKAPTLAGMSACTKTEGSKNSKHIPSNAATTDDLHQKLDSIRALLSRRRAGAGVTSFLLPISLHELEGWVINDINTTLSSLPVEPSHQQNEQCLEESQLVEMMDEGLLALHKRADLRSVLIQKVAELVPTAKEVILDMDLPMPQPKRGVEKEKINLRNVLDSQLLEKASTWVDKLVELCGGYHDSLDQYFDSIAGDRSVGRSIVSKLLREAGKVDIPLPKTLVDKYLPRIRL